MKPSLLAAALACCAPPAAAAPAGAADALVARAQSRWEASPHGPMLARILPPTLTPARLPQPDSAGAALLVRYCTQCHHLPNPAMHPADRWPRVVDRMVQRMKGLGNMGVLMKDMMADVRAPSQEELHVLNVYLRSNAQRRLDPARYPDLAQRGWAFKEACSQCHALPDPASRTATQWADIVARMERNMAWMNRVVGSKPDLREPQLRRADILAYLRRHAAPEARIQ